MLLEHARRTGPSETAKIKCVSSPRRQSESRTPPLALAIPLMPPLLPTPAAPHSPAPTRSAQTHDPGEVLPARLATHTQACPCSRPVMRTRARTHAGAEHLHMLEHPPPNRLRATWQTSLPRQKKEMRISSRVARAHPPRLVLRRTIAVSVCSTRMIQL